MQDRVEAAIQREQLAEVEEEMDELNRRLAALTLTSPAQGELELIQPADLPGRYLEKGSVLGLVHGAGGAIASVVIPQADAGLVRRDTRGLSVRFPGRPESESPVQLVADVPSGSYLLPSPALGSMAGGRISVDTRDERGITALEPIFQYDIRLPERSFPPYSRRPHPGPIRAFARDAGQPLVPLAAPAAAVPVGLLRRKILLG